MESTSKKLTGVVVSALKERAAGKAGMEIMELKENLNFGENFDPNVCSSGSKLYGSVLMMKSMLSAKNPSRGKSVFNRLDFPSAEKKKIQERKFVIAKKKPRVEESDSSAAAAVVDCEKCEKAAGKSRCFCVAYESLRASHEDFLKNNQNQVDFDVLVESERGNGELSLKESRDLLLEAARQSAPESGSGRVMHLVKAFEKLLLMPKPGDFDAKKEKNVINWALPGLQLPPKVPRKRISSSPSDIHQTAERLRLDSRPSFSSDCSQGSLPSKTSSRGRRRSRPSSSDRREWKAKQQKAISQKPFMLTTEKRGRFKEEKLMKKLDKELVEEEKLRTPIVLDLPRTTDEPEILARPPAKESTKPVDMVLHSDIRAMERAEFDNQVTEKMKLIEQYRMERGRQERLAEEEEIRRLRKGLVFKAQPMPYFDRPFVPKRSLKQLTIPKETKFHLPRNKKMKCSMPSDEV